MKQIHKFLLTSLCLITAVLSSCSLMEGRSNLTIHANPVTAKTIYSTVNFSNIAKVAGFISDGTNETAMAFDPSSVCLEAKGLQPGNWTVNIYAYLADGTLCASAKEQIDLVAGDNTFNIDLYWVTEGNGQLIYSINWPATVGATRCTYQQDLNGDSWSAESELSIFHNTLNWPSTDSVVVNLAVPYPGTLIRFHFYLPDSTIPILTLTEFAQIMPFMSSMGARNLLATDFKARPIPTYNFSMERTAEGMQLNWNNNPEAVNNIVGYRLERKLDTEPDSSYTLLCTLNSTELTYTDTSVLADTFYHYRLTAWNAWGETSIRAGSPSEYFDTYDTTVLSLSDTWNTASDADKYNLVIPERINGQTITHSATSAFRYSGIVSISFHDSLSGAGDYFAANCPSLARACLPEGFTTISNHMFYDCSNLHTVHVPNSLLSLGDYAFSGCAALESIVLPESVTLGHFLFEDCTALTSCTLSGNIIQLPSGLFRNCTSLQQITVPSTVSFMNGYVFQGCTSLSQITLPESLEYLGAWTFQGCTRLTSITIPAAVSTIGDEVFESCTGLQSIIMQNTIPPDWTTAGYDIFDNTGTCSIQVPAASLEAYRTTEPWVEYSARMAGY